MSRPVRVAIIGGGCGAMTAAFELSAPEHAGRYDITVYQEGWRLGGKGASGRGVHGRIEEHGLHIWLGYYENSFRMMRACYDELAAMGEGDLFGDWRDAFTPEPDIGLFSPTDSAGWQKWRGQFPLRPGLPGDPIARGEGPSLVTYMRGGMAMLQTLLWSVEVSRWADGEAPPAWASEAAAGDPQKLLEAIRALLGRGVFAGAVVLSEGLSLLRAALGAVSTHKEGAVARLADAVGAGLREIIEEHLIADDPDRHLWEVIDVMMAAYIGIIRHGLLTDPRGLDAIDDWDIREWLRLNGASERSVNSPYVRGCYDLGFACAAGDPNRPSFAAGVGIRGAMRMFFGYRGALFWRMKSGMGDVVFAPLYALLRRRGVKFAFFHRLTNVAIAHPGPIILGERTHVTALDFDVQARVAGGGEYAPLVTVAGRPCWPSQPDFSQLEEGAALAAAQVAFESHWDRRAVGAARLEVGRDFDLVVLGVSIGALPHVCPDILARDARWRAMVDNVQTVATQAFQIWLSEDLEQLGWRGPPYITSGFVKPFDTWCDMAHVVPEEAWPRRPLTAVYFCSALPDGAEGAPTPADPTYPQRRADEVRANAAAFLAGPMRQAWPLAFDAAGAFRWSLLVAPETAGAGDLEGEGRFSTQYWRANVSPTERYVLSVPGSGRFRISPLDMTYDNMTIAGDWTACGLNSGCTESAVMSGRLAAHALSGSPRLEDITGYDHI